MLCSTRSGKRSLTTAAIAVGVLVAWGRGNARADVLAYTINLTGFSATGNVTNGGGHGGGVYDIGDVFTTSTALSIDGLAAYDYKGTSVTATLPGNANNTGPQYVALYDVNGSQSTALISATVTSNPTYNLDGTAYTGSNNGESGDGWSVAGITPYTLAAGTYMLVVQNNSAFFPDGMTLNSAPGVGAVSGYAFNNASLGAAVTYPSSNVSSADWLQANLVIATPEPATIGLLAVGAAGLLLIKRRRTA